ncbi:23S rRNA (uracil(1939)-C(5))-methyltransferase RlmD [Desulforhopalus sp. 52FAK]
MHKETVTIKKIVNGGFGLGHLPSKQVVLVQFSLPGENIIVTTQEIKKNYLFGKAAQIENKHPARITPPCQYYGRCGGCNLQHCNYDAQTTFKRDIVVDLLLRQDVLTLGALKDTVREVIPAPSPFNYRQRIRLQVGDNETLGFNRFRSNDIVEVDKCLLAEPSINLSLTALRKSEPAMELLELSTELELQQNPTTDAVSCIFHFKRKPRPADRKRAQKMCSEISSIDRIFFKGEDFPMVGPVGAETSESNKMLNLHYQKLQGIEESLQLGWEVGGFCQVNLAQNKRMIETVIDFCALNSSDTVLDLYCGMGNFAIPLSSLAASVHGIEGQGASIRCAKENSASAGRTNTIFTKQPVHKGCDQLIAESATFDCVIIDPPRQGAPELAQQLSKLCKKTLVYISCDPATLCRDLKELTSKGFTIQKIQPIDMFPQTHHIETVVVLKK